MGSYTSSTANSDACPKTDPPLLEKHKQQSHHSLTRRKSSLQYSFKRHSSINSTNTTTTSNSSGEDEINFVSKQPSILGFVEDLIGGVKQQQQLNQSSSNGKFEKKLLEKKVNFSRTSDGEDDIKPVLSKSVSFTRARSKTQSNNALRNSLPSSSSTSINLSKPLSSLNNRIHLRSSYNSWNHDTICWEELKTQSLERENGKKNKSTLFSLQGGLNQKNHHHHHHHQHHHHHHHHSHDQQQDHSSNLNFTRKQMNRVGMEVEATPLGNFLKTLSTTTTPSSMMMLSQSMSNKEQQQPHTTHGQNSLEN